MADSDGNKTVISAALFPAKQVAEMMDNFKNWITKQPLAVEATVVTVCNGVYGAGFSYVFDTIALQICSAFPLVPTPFKAALESRVMNARDFGLLLGVDGGIRCVMKNIRGKEDIQTRIVAGFGGGAMVAMVHCKRPEFIISSGVLFALLEAAMFKVIMFRLCSGLKLIAMERKCFQIDTLMDKLDYDKKL
ncbi:chloroplastic import inner membrane translocase subunit HP30-2-like [Bidens hawaiensis]|uniref:chloroplastic import inner membrane translocase subunit HP30-2-like n=1 Tax=Bidens hawaiensis TaxID=980011 RepID=UPI00404A1FB6